MYVYAQEMKIKPYTIGVLMIYVPNSEPYLNTIDGRLTIQTDCLCFMNAFISSRLLEDLQETGIRMGIHFGRTYHNMTVLYTTISYSRPEIWSPKGPLTHMHASGAECSSIDGEHAKAVQRGLVQEGIILWIISPFRQASDASLPYQKQGPIQRSEQIRGCHLAYDTEGNQTLMFNRSMCIYYLYYPQQSLKLPELISTGGYT